MMFWMWIGFIICQIILRCVPSYGKNMDGRGKYLVNLALENVVRDNNNIIKGETETIRGIHQNFDNTNDNNLESHPDVNQANVSSINNDKHSHVNLSEHEYCDSIHAFDPESSSVTEAVPSLHENSRDCSSPDLFGPDSDADPAYQTESSDKNTSSDEESNKNYGSTAEDSKNNLDKNELHKGRKKKGRKRKHSNQSRADRKRYKDSNQLYINTKDKIIKPKVFTDFKCTCILKCYEIVNVTEKKHEFERFWSLASYDAQTAYIGALVKEIPKKRQYGRDPNKRKFSRKYTLASKTVCRPTFCKTLSISPFRVNTALMKVRGAKPLKDQRGIKQGGHNRLSNNEINSVVNQINKIPRYKSHYSRNETETEYLPPDMTLQKMYDMYKTENEKHVSFSSYKRIFYENFNLKIKALKKDTCNTCDSLKIQIDKETDQVKKDALIVKHEEHISLAQSARNLMTSNLKMAKDCEDVECLTFDLEKTLPLPRIPTSIVFYKRQLWLYNAGVHSGKDDAGYCYVWIEGEAGRGAQEIGSCLMRHIKNTVKDTIKHLILWCDSCGGQNRNIKIVLLLKTVLHSHPNLENIIIRFLYSGHSFLPNDTDFGDIECALKRQQRLYTPNDYIEVMKNCRKKRPLIVKRMKSENFFGTIQLEKKIVNRKVSTENKKINWLHLREIELKKKEPYKIFVKNDFSDADVKEIDLQRKTRGRPSINFTDELVSLWPNGKPIAPAKLVDIKAMMHLIPSDASEFYLNLHSNTDIEEDILGYNGELDFDLE